MGAVVSTTAHYFEQGQYVGQRTLSFYDPDGKPASPPPVLPNLTYYCGQCGEIWGKVVYEPGASSFWALEHRYCAAHGDGCFLSGCDHRQLSLCSTPLLAREALLLSLHFKE